MLDIKLISSEPDAVKKALASRSPALAQKVDEILSLNTQYKKILTEIEKLRAQRKELSKNIGALQSSDPAAADKIKEEVARIKEDLQAGELALEPLKQKTEELLLSIPNMPDISVKQGRGAADNVVVKEVLTAKRDFAFTPRDHHELGERLGILDFERAVKLSGSRFSMMRGAGSRLERALINFMLDRQSKRGYVEITPPLIVNKEILYGTGQLPKFREDMYELAGEPKQFLISTAEIPLSNIHREEILDAKTLPVKYAAFTPCFRKESGTYGKDTRGLIRNHQFDKVELVMLSWPEESFERLQDMTRDAEAILSELGLPYRVLELCSGDMGFSAAKTYDLEVWMPGENQFREISSCSNCTDFQSRRMNLRFREGEDKPKFVHTLNGSGLAVGRTLAAVLENYQQQDGSIIIPDALRQFFGADAITAE